MTDDATKRARKAHRKLARKSFGSPRYLLMICSFFPSVLATSRLGTDLLGDAQIPVALILCIPTAFLGMALIRHQKRFARKLLLEQAVCPDCGYDLTANVSGVCPECGTETKT